ncbi:hypothetical protein [Geotalea toluenoxydans]|uniref:hypothetical protein n=1 Tax=Geotalea toluenoxydans TaxID=421624 RepID=UPI000A7A81CA
MIDLHIHSTYSDGIYKPAELVAMAAAKGLRPLPWPITIPLPVSTRHLKQAKAGMWK